MLTLVARPPFTLVQFSWRAQPLMMPAIVLCPAGLPSAPVMSQSPSQKSNCRYSGVEQAGGAGVEAAVAAGDGVRADAGGRAPPVAARPAKRRPKAVTRRFIRFCRTRAAQTYTNAGRTRRKNPPDRI